MIGTPGEECGKIQQLAFADDVDIIGWIRQALKLYLTWERSKKKKKKKGLTINENKTKFLIATNE